jgi:hypothetical protein
MIIGDEYHHYPTKKNDDEYQVERFLNRCPQVILLSDSGQHKSSYYGTAGRHAYEEMEARYDHQEKQFDLLEIARSSTKIVGASATFRPKVSLNQLTHVMRRTIEGTCKSRFFELTQSGVSDRHQQYAAQVAISLEVLLSGGIEGAAPNKKLWSTLKRSHNYADHQIAIIVRDEPFRDGLLKALEEYLRPEAEDLLQLKEGGVKVALRFVRAEEAAATVSAPNDFSFDIVLDCMDNLDGQEFPAVMLVAMDVSKRKATSAEWNAAPSCLYRGMTRAQFYLEIVNECIDDGLLSHIRNYTFNSEDDYNHADHIARMKGRLPITPAELPEASSPPPYKLHSI